jgi:cytochrome c553
LQPLGRIEEKQMTQTPIMSSAAAALIALTVAGPVSAQQPDPRSAQYIAANCANCHGTQGRSAGAMPSLAGQKKEFLAEQMRAFRDGKKAATIMHQLAKGYSDAQIDMLAEHFARQPAK